jgi:hypothetical protein
VTTTHPGYGEAVTFGEAGEPAEDSPAVVVCDCVQFASRVAKPIGESHGTPRSSSTTAQPGDGERSVVVDAHVDSVVQRLCPAGTSQETP